LTHPSLPVGHHPLPHCTQLRLAPTTAAAGMQTRQRVACLSWCWTLAMISCLAWMGCTSRRTPHLPLVAVLLLGTQAGRRWWSPHRCGMEHLLNHAAAFTYFLYPDQEGWPPKQWLPHLRISTLMVACVAVPLQFESIAARKALPCFDEPRLKVSPHSFGPDSVPAMTTCRS
jgi:hypothetical protein